MKNATLILAALLIVQTAFAQNQIKNSNTRSTTIDKTERPVEKRQKYEVKASTEFLEKELEKEINAKKLVVKIDSATQQVIILIDSSVTDLFPIRQKLTKKGFNLSPITEKQNKDEQSSVEKKEILQIPKEKYNPEIDRFLNIEDQTIFTDFKQFSHNDIHPQRREYYQLLEYIHEFDILVAKIGSMSASDVSLIKKNLIQADDINNLIVSYTTEEKGELYYLLTETQKDYYRNIAKVFYKLKEEYNL